MMILGNFSQQLDIKNVIQAKIVAVDIGKQFAYYYVGTNTSEYFAADAVNIFILLLAFIMITSNLLGERKLLK